MMDQYPLPEDQGVFTLQHKIYVITLLKGSFVNGSTRVAFFAKDTKQVIDELFRVFGIAHGISDKQSLEALLGSGKCEIRVGLRQLSIEDFNFPE